MAKNPAIKVQCNECEKRFATRKIDPECPQCGGVDIEVRGDHGHDVSDHDEMTRRHLIALATDEFGEDTISPDGKVVMTWQGSFVQCRDGKYARINAVDPTAYE